MLIRILLVEDDPGTRFGFVRYFSREGYAIHEAANITEAGDALNVQRFDAIVLDINLPDGNGLDFIETVRANDSCIPIIVITGSGDVPLAVNAMQRGADNFLTKPVDNAGLSVFLRKNLEVGALKRRQAARIRLQPANDTFVGESVVMRGVYEEARSAAEGEIPVLITGETGTGKGKLTKFIHRQSRRSANELVEVNCSGLRGELLAREMFGHVRGAFTSADQDRKGLLDIADRGTLFLDEIGDMGLDVQAQFLKVLEDKCYRRLGDVKLLHSDFRLICATNRDIDKLVREGAFRRDLYYRINLMTIHLPPLRERTEEIPAIADFLLRDLGVGRPQLSEAVIGILERYTWPGNIRELRNILERALLLARGKSLQPEHFSGLVMGAPLESAFVTIQDMERHQILKAMRQYNGDIELTARKLNISRATLYRRLKSFSEAGHHPA